MKSTIKKLLRTNKYLEMLSYLMQNNILNKVLNTSGEGSFDTSVEGMYEHAKKIAKQYRDNYNGNLENKTILEIGTGYTRSTMLFLIKEYDLQKVYCYDRFNCLHENDAQIIEKYNLSPYLDRLEYISGTNDTISEHIETGSIDYIISNAVLEHVDTLEILFDNLSKVFKKGGQMYHKVDLRCHNRFKKHGELYFHTFSEMLWNMMGDKIGQPNRKLLKDYYKIFKKFDLKCDTNIVERFSNEELSKAKNYLNNIDIKDYETSIVEFKLCQK